MLHVIRAVDKANGYVFGGLDSANDSIFGTADRWEAWDRHNRDVEEKYLNPTDPEAIEKLDLHNSGLLGEIYENNVQ